MAEAALRSEERIGLAVAIAAHAGLALLLVLRPPTPQIVPPPERITVTLAEESAAVSTSPEPQGEAAPSVAPEPGEAAPAEAAPADAEPEVPPEPPAPQPAPAKPAPPKPAPPKPAPPRPEPPKAQPVPRPAIKLAPAPRPTPRPTMTPRATPIPRVTPAPRVTPRAAASPARPVAKPVPRPVASPSARPNTRVAVTRGGAATATRPATKSGTSPAARPATKAGGSRIGNDFLSGVQGTQPRTAARGAPAATFGPAVRATFAQSVLRQVKPNWQGRVPQGVNTDKLVTILSIELNRDGTLAAAPTVVGQEGIDDSNRAQARRHAEEAIKAVQLSAPFSLPPDQFEGWRRLPPLRFRKSS